MSASLTRCGAVAALILLTTVATPAAQDNDDPAALFQANIAQYLTTRDQLRQGVAREHIIDPRIREISGALLAARIRRARAAAEPYDVIPAALADIIRDRLHRAFDSTEVDLLLRDLYPDGILPPAARINVHYDDDCAVLPPGSVLAALPPVPGVLGYRLVARDVVLWDEEAELAVDVIAGALPEPHAWRFLEMSSFALYKVVSDALSAANLTPRDLVEESERDAVPGAAPPVVGALFDWDTGNVMPPSVLHALPALPRPLEYRFVGRDLVVINVRSGYVEGILWNVVVTSVTDGNRVL